MNETLKAIVKALDEKKAVDIKVIQIDAITSLCDHFIICNGTSTTHVKTLADECEVATDKLGIPLLLDYGDFIVHVYNKDTRNFYNLEKLWKDGIELEINDLLED